MGGARNRKVSCTKGHTPEVDSCELGIAEGFFDLLPRFDGVELVFEPLVELVGEGNLGHLGCQSALFGEKSEHGTSGWILACPSPVLPLQHEAYDDVVERVAFLGGQFAAE